MNIQPTSQNNPHFGKLYAPRKLKLAESVRSKDLLKLPAIKECADKFDVIVKRGKSYGKDFIEDAVPHFSTKCALAGASLLGTASALCFNSIGATILGGVVGLFVGAILSIPIGTTLIPTNYMYEIFGRKKYKDGSEIKTKTINTSSCKDYYLKHLDFVQELETKDRQRFLKIIASKYPKDGMYTAKNILEILRSKEINDDYNNGEAFNYPIDINGNSTLLMKFFDIKRTNENAKEYDKIASIIKSTPNINFNQQDKLGITIIENVLNSENTDALEIIKDVEFEYTPYLDTIFNNIKDENFKAKTKSLKINFNATKKALFEEKSMQKFQEAATCLDSPFCNSREKALEIWDMAQEQFGAESLKEINMILYKYLPEPMRIES